MLYIIRSRNRTDSWIETSNCKVIAATPAYRWAIGKTLQQVQDAVEEYGATLRIPLDQTKRSPSLGTGPHLYKERVPTDSEILAHYLPDS